MRIINVIKNSQNAVISIESFPVFEDHQQKDVIGQAEKKFLAWARELEIQPQNEDDCLMDGFFESENGLFSVNLVWSYV
jgi:hypothetical protein